MRFRNLGKTGILVSEIGVGTWGMGGAFGETDDIESRKALEKAFELGINFFDTADIYGKGRSERLIGETFRDRRAEVIIATKVGWDFYKGEVKRNFDIDYIQFALDESLKRLKTTWVDIYQLHNPPLEVLERGDVFGILEDLQAEGKIHFYGVSLNTLEEAELAIKNGRPSTFQLVYNILRPYPARRIFDLAEKNGIGIIVRTPLEYGFLTGKYGEDVTFREDDWRKSWEREKIQELIRKVKTLDFLVEGRKKTLTQASLQFVISDNRVSTVIPGSKTIKNIEESVEVSDMGALTQDELRLLEELYQNDFRLT